MFRAAVEGVRPIAADRIHHQPPPPAPWPVKRLQDEAAALAASMDDLPSLELRLEGGDEPVFLRSGLPKSVLRDLRRGRWVVQDHLDLHGATRTEARRLVGDFLAQAAVRGCRCLRIVHGKGHGSPGREPVLKRLVQGWLTRRHEVLAYCQARAVEGGAGAMIVLLRAPR